MKTEIIFKFPIMVFINKFGKFSYTPSFKKQDNTYEYAFVPKTLKFPQGKEPKNKELIQITKCFEHGYNWNYNGKKGTTYYTYVLEYETVKAKK